MLHYNKAVVICILCPHTHIHCIKHMCLLYVVAFVLKGVSFTNVAN